MECRLMDLHLDGIVSMVGSLETLDTDSHLSLTDDGSWSVVVDGVAHAGVQLVDVLAIDDNSL